MRASPRTWPSIRWRRLPQDVLISVRMAYRYTPLGYQLQGRKKMSHSDHRQHGHGHHGAPPKDGVIDPVCGMTVDPHTTPHRAEHTGQPYYFCSAGCRTKFAADPQRYLGEAR